MATKDVLRHSLWICWKDLLEFSRSKMRLTMLVLMPLFMMVMIGFIFPSSSSISNTSIALANNDTGSLGTGFIQQLEIINNQTGIMKLITATNFNDKKPNCKPVKLTAASSFQRISHPIFSPGNKVRL